MYKKNSFKTTLIVVCTCFLVNTSLVCQTVKELPKETKENYVSYRDASISDEFNDDVLDTNKWGRRNTGTSSTKNHYKDESLVTMEKEKLGDNVETNFVSIKGTAKNGPIITAGIVSRASGYYGFYVVRFRFRGFDTQEIKDKGTIWHPSVWSGRQDNIDGVDRFSSAADHWIEIDLMEWENGENGWSSDAPARFTDSKGIKRKVITKGAGAEKAIMKKEVVQSYQPVWQTIGLEYTPDYLKLWKWDEDDWVCYGERVVRFVDDDMVNPEIKYSINSIGKKARKPCFWLLGNIVAGYINERVEKGTNMQTMDDMSVDFDFFRYYRHVGAEHIDWPWENEKPNGSPDIMKFD